ncbi:transposase [Ahrensia sp. 13_GOM-1096m]|uniref:transposase n=1 Tax=Ahrensia sp. 13_GOM-1096m TaxID=1380380 RepID=UPI0009E01E89|nr:transposase [Ahrensia sp. 13_GOM-1096m]
MMELDEELLDSLSSQIKSLDNEIKAQIETDARMQQHSQILRSIPGIGTVLCAALIGEIPELGTISDNQVAALAGIAPIKNGSGRTDSRRSIKGGRYNIRCLLY